MEIVKRFYIEFAKYKYTYLFALLLNILVTLLGNISPYFIRELTRNISGNNYELAVFTLTIFLLSFFVKNIINNLSTYLQDLTLAKVGVNLQQKVFNKLHELDYEFYSGKSSGSLISILKRGDSALFDIYYGIHDNLLEALISFIFLAVSFSFIENAAVFGAKESIDGALFVLLTVTVIVSDSITTPSVTLKKIE